MASRAGVSVIEAFVATADRQRLFLRYWRPPDVRAVVAAVHGPGADGTRFSGLAGTLAAHGVATCAIDLRGCGRSSGTRRRAGAIAAQLTDVAAMMATVGQRDPGQPVFMLGHGFGAMLACRYALRHASGPGGIICEGIALEAGGHDLPERIAAALLRFGRRLYEPLDRLQAPLLLLHGSEDAMAPLAASEYLHRCAASSDRTLQVFEGHGHELINGPGHALVRDKACQWIAGRLDAGRRHHHIGIEYINE